MKIINDPLQPDNKLVSQFQVQELEERLENKWYVVNNGPQEDTPMEVTVVVD
ncbi:hypothetical protein [Spirosoma sp. KCTC 42546]|uniref:hypothetical protein n=1 Tax=Spirosoma sp. KCTC 42546 TaxID=2520506 RepID=UPI00143CDD73|nr:hypothetical protein [Spirosoma sp. KCTC 42546]